MKWWEKVIFASIFALMLPAGAGILVAQLSGNWKFGMVVFGALFATVLMLGQRNPRDGRYG